MFRSGLVVSSLWLGSADPTCSKHTNHQGTTLGQENQLLQVQKVHKHKSRGEANIHHAADVRAFRQNLKQAPAPCQGDSSTWSAGFGNCDTYAPDAVNAQYCDDQSGGLHAKDVCSQCGYCGTGGAGVGGPDAHQPTQVNGETYCEQGPRAFDPELCLDSTCCEWDGDSCSSGIGQEICEGANATGEMSCELCAHVIVNSDNCWNFDMVGPAVMISECGNVSYAFDPDCEEVVRGLCLGDPTDLSLLKVPSLQPPGYQPRFVSAWIPADSFFNCMGVIPGQPSIDCGRLEPFHLAFNRPGDHGGNHSIGQVIMYLILPERLVVSGSSSERLSVYELGSTWPMGSDPEPVLTDISWNAVSTEVLHFNGVHEEMTLFGNGCCRFDDWSAINHGQQTDTQCNNLCLADSSCIAADIARTQSSDLHLWDCSTYLGNGNNFNTECGTWNQFERCSRKENQTYGALITWHPLDPAVELDNIHQPNDQEAQDWMSDHLETDMYHGMQMYQSLGGQMPGQMGLLSWLNTKGLVSQPKTAVSKTDFFAAAAEEDAHASEVGEVEAVELTSKVKVAAAKLAGSRRRAPSL